ncbi:MAG: nuclear transport factor 2 family protein, partial [Acidimicrobiia bacterium]|nr:nuclear transport factor 2 family protein [Acidimicrobiia bacterium]
RDLIDLTIAYCWALDGRNWDELDNVFTPDATGDYGIAQLAGIDDFKALVKRSLGHLDLSQHLVGSHQVTIDGDTATVRCYLHAQHTKRGTEGGDNYIVGGTYEDQAVRTDDGWRISHRALAMTWFEGNRAVIGV